MSWIAVLDLGLKATELSTDKGLAQVLGCTWHGSKQVAVLQPSRDGHAKDVSWPMTQVVRVFGTEKVSLSTSWVLC